MKYCVNAFKDKSVASVTLSVELGESVFVSVIGHTAVVQGPLTLDEYCTSDPLCCKNRFPEMSSCESVKLGIFVSSEFNEKFA